MWWFKVLIFLPCWVMARNYCEICQDHTMCKYQGSGPTCGSNQESGVSEAEIQQILKLHNDFRAKIAIGMEHRGCPGPQPSAANMQELIWDHNMAAVAQKWADQCMFQHDACRDDPRFQVGQNMYFSSGFSNVDWSRAVSSWYEEVTRFNSRMVDSFKFQPTVGHYTQLIWGNTRSVGCGRVTYGGAYRLEGYQRMEYVLSSSRRNDSLINTEDKNRRGFNIRPDIADIPTTVLYSVEDMEEQASNPSTTTQAAKENNPKQSTIEIFTEKVIPITTEIKEEQTTKLCTTSEALEENNFSESTTETSTEKVIPIKFEIKKEKSTKTSTTNQASKENRSGETLTETSTEKIIQITSETKELENSTSTNQALENRFSETATETSIKKIIPTTSEIIEEKPTTPSITTQALKQNNSRETTTDNSTENIGPLASGNQETPKIKNSSSQNPKFSIFIPGYWISNSKSDSKGQVAGSFQSMDFSASGDLNSFIKETSSVGALKIASWDHLHGRWNLEPNLEPTKAAENPARIQVNRLTQTGWVRSTYDNLGRDQILVCNYGPAGNYLYQPIYVRGQPCSRCPFGSVCRNGLCS